MMGAGLDADPLGATPSVLRSLVGLVNEGELRERLRFTSAIANGRDLYAFRVAVNDAANTLYFREAGNGQVVVVSEPFDKETDWTEVPANHALIARASDNAKFIPFDLAISGGADRNPPLSERLLPAGNTSAGWRMTFASDVLKLLRLDSSDGKQHLVIRSAGGRGKAAEYSFGIEEEYFLADRRTLEVAIQTPNELFESANWSTGGQAMREMLQSPLRSPPTFMSMSMTRGKSLASCVAKSQTSPHNMASSSWPAARIRRRSGACRSRARSRATRR